MIDIQPRPRNCCAGRPKRRGAAAVEAAVCFPLLLTFLLGVWEVGRMAQVQEVLSNAAHEGARLASMGMLNQTPVTVSVVQQAVKDYMTSAGLPSGAVSGAQIQVVNKSANTWTDPADAQPLDAFQVTVTIPSGTAFNSLRWIMLPSITGATQISATTNWMSMNDSEVTVNTQLPY
ncbi:MAG TPA: TadE/TadG family type IV pilus assembly protein [Pirellulales bacterium]|nr:TadE/TadG family type IV pilus assembly protein [Pirellulales bacterium]